VASALVSTLKSKLGADIQVLGTLSGTKLKGLQYVHPLTTNIHPVVAGDFVSTDTGTGLVHTAPAHGLDDYRVCTREGIKVLSLGGPLSTLPSFLNPLVLISHRS